MNKAFEKIIDKLREVPTEYRHEEYNQAIHDVINFISRFAIDYNNGWLPCSERLPEECVQVNVTWINIFQMFQVQYEGGKRCLE